MVAGWSGSSITANVNTWSFRLRSNSYLNDNFPENGYTFPNASIGGHNIWSNLVRLSRDMLAYNPNMLAMDTANSSGVGFQAAALEAYIRRVWTANPNTRLLLWNFAQVTDINVNASIETPTNQTDIDAVEAVCDHYGIVLLDIWQVIIDLVDDGHNLNEYYQDTSHLNQAGHAVAYDLIQIYLHSGGSVAPAVLPARIYDNGDYENASVIKTGQQNDGTTGSWSTVATTGIQSSSAGATVTFSATCQSFGCYRADSGTNTVEVSIDGGAFTAMSFYQNGTEVPGGRGAHTFVIKVVSGTVRIDEFWAV